jgi:hypothetical protein
LHTTGDMMIGEWSLRHWQALALPLSTLGLALLVLPLLVKRPGKVEYTAPFRALALIGVMSYAVLIVNDPMRLVASQIRLEGAPDAVWWTFLVVVYVPLSILLAWPLARVLGLMPPSAPAGERSPIEVAPEPERVLAPAAT